MLEQIKWWRALVENQSCALVERLLQRADAQQEIRQFGILLKDRQHLGGLGFAFAANARGRGIGVRNGLGRLTVGGGFDFLRLGLAFVLELADENLTFGGHALKHGLRHILRQAEFLDAEKCDFDAAIVRLQLRLDGLLDFVFDGVKLQLLRVGVHEIGQRMSADHGAFGAAQHAFKHALGGHGRTAGEFREERLCVGNLPANINHHEQIIVVGRKTLAESVLEILHALIKFIDFLHRPWPFEIRARLDEVARRFAKRRDDGDFGLADLKNKQQQRENHNQHCADDDGHYITFHGDELLGDDGTFKFKRSSRILSSRSKITTSCVFVTSKMYLRAPAVASANAWKYLRCR